MATITCPECGHAFHAPVKVKGNPADQYRRVEKLLNAGLSENEIARKLGITQPPVNKYRNIKKRTAPGVLKDWLKSCEEPVHLTVNAMFDLGAKFREDLQRAEYEVLLGRARATKASRKLKARAPRARRRRGRK